MIRAHLILLSIATLAAGVADARAQPPGTAGDRPDRLRVSVNAGKQATKTSFTETRTFEEFVEQGSLTMRRDIPTRPFYGAGVTVRVWRGLAFGAAASYFTDKSTGTVDAKVPHPFFFNQPRAVSGKANGTVRQETAGHVHIGWIIPATDHVEFTLSAGPSVFLLRQGLVTSVAYTQAFPYDAATFDQAVTELVKDTIIGYNAGIDMTWRFAAHVGVGGLISFSRGKKTLQPSNGDPIPLQIGGLHAGGGVRLIF